MISTLEAIWFERQHLCADRSNANGVFAMDLTRRIADISDGTSNTIMASEYIPGVDAANSFKAD